MDINVSDNYAVHVLRLWNTKSGELDLKKVGEKCQDKNEFILHNYLRNSRWDQITNTIKEFDPPISVQLENGNWVHRKSITILEDNNITLYIQTGIIWPGWLTAEYTSCTHASIIFLNVDNSILYNKVK